MTFRDLSNGSRFCFEWENVLDFGYYGLARGPWVKTGSRSYRHETDTALSQCRIGSIKAEVVEV